jgi:mannosylglycoprotein endo-beta-mannosidase
LEAKIQTLEHEVALDPRGELLDDLRNAKQSLEEIYNYQIEGIIMRSKEKHYEMGEKNTKYFLNLAKKNKTKSTITQLQSGQNIEREPTEIMKLTKQFYVNLYKQRKVDLSCTFAQNLFNNENIPKLSEEAKQTCEGAVRESELLKTLKTFPKGKTPGNDGLPTEFYLKFWQLISESLISMVQEVYEMGEMTVSQRQSVITLLEKGGKDKLDLGNWRPISLINVDAKLISKCISLRLKRVLPDIIHENQVGFVAGRNIDEGILLLKNIMEHTRSENLPGLLLAIDFKKAFDSVNWEYMRKALTVFNFGHTISRWVNIFYTNMQSCVMNNGFSTGYFEVGRGVRQGDPLSPYLFIIALELIGYKSGTQLISKESIFKQKIN